MNLFTSRNERKKELQKAALERLNGTFRHLALPESINFDEYFKP